MTTEEPQSGSGQDVSHVQEKVSAEWRNRLRAVLNRTLPDSNSLVHDILGHQFQLPLMEGGCSTKECILISATILFAKRGYSAVSIRDIARVNDVKPSALYNHFASKESLLEAAYDYLMKLYFLYIERLERAISQAGSFEEVVATLFYEPKRMSNHFGAYGFTLINLGELYSPLSAKVKYNMLNHSINYIKEKFDDCVAKGWVKPFGTFWAGTFIINAVFTGWANKVLEFEGLPTIYRTGDMIAALELFILSATERM
ncbi:MAG: TetR/AcrR family transcriptional regulator [Deltaproteobacteria bacterium]|nr:TetR/AcrR family transcriptional regulator [Deltaproteobacteria bacterium]